MIQPILALFYKDATCLFDINNKWNKLKNER
jgi:hypothetical protein